MDEKRAHENIIHSRIDTMSGRIGKVIAKKNRIRQPSLEIPSPVKIIKTSIITNNNDDEGDDENKNPIADTETETVPLVMNSNQNNNDINQMAVILANGQPLLTNFEEKYLIDLILKPLNKDIEIILEEKIQFILQMNYGSPSSLFTLNHQWIYDFILKHFQTLINHPNSSYLFEKFLNKSYDKNNSVTAYKYWQIKTLFNEHSKQQPSAVSQKRRMTVRHIDLK